MTLHVNDLIDACAEYARAIESILRTYQIGSPEFDLAVAECEPTLNRLCEQHALPVDFTPRPSPYLLDEGHAA